MPRINGSHNQSDYRYKVTNYELGSSEYFISQREITDKYGIKRTGIYYLIHHPDRIVDHKNLKIIKLDTPLPVYEKVVEQEDDGGYTIKYNKIIY